MGVFFDFVLKKYSTPWPSTLALFSLQDLSRKASPPSALTKKVTTKVATSFSPGASAGSTITASEETNSVEILTPPNSPPGRPLGAKNFTTKIKEALSLHLKRKQNIQELRQLQPTE
jgi:hypothetical protein